MKKTLLLFVLSIALSTVSMAQFKIGAGLMFATNGNSIGAQAKSLIGVSEDIDLGLGAGVYFTKGTPFVIDADAQFDVLEINDVVHISPFAGLNFVTGSNKLGINLGLHTRFPIQERHIYIEPKYTLLSSNSFIIAAGMYF